MNKTGRSLWKEFSKGIIRENPVLRLVLGTCSTLAITTSAGNAIGMGLATTFVLVGSNTVISLLRRVIPDKVRIPSYITLIAGFVTIVQMAVEAYSPGLKAALGIYLPLIVVNCIILGRAEMFASKNKVLPSVLDGLGMGAGFTAALLAMGIVRELLGSGSLFGLAVTAGFIDPILIFLLPPGGFFVFGVLIAVANKLAERKGGAPAELGCCQSCPYCGTCAAPEEPGGKEPGND